MKTTISPSDFDDFLTQELACAKLIRQEDTYEISLKKHIVTHQLFLVRNIFLNSTNKIITNIQTNDKKLLTNKFFYLIKKQDKRGFKLTDLNTPNDMKSNQYYPKQ